ncbi:Apoptosis-inducing factor 2 [Entomortierella beljakovae]|nr:Apoptosis-inducing factor 2 [Entomortierella beljakovae]
MSSQPIQVVVVGGSFAGISVINQLLTSLKSSKKNVQITLVEKHDARYHSLGAFRSLVDAEYGEKIWVPYTNLFPKDSHHRIIQDTLSQVYHHHIVLGSGKTVSFDYLVLCTGSDNPAPGKFHGITSSAEAIAITTKARADISNSKNVLVIGGGASGVELVGEIKNAYPNKNVVLIHGTSKLVDYEGYASSMKSQALKHLEGLGVKVILNEHVTIEGLDQQHSIRVGNSVIKTKSGDTVESDIQFLTVGNWVNTSYISTLKPEGNELFDSSSLVNSGKNTIKVRKTLQLADKSFPHIFAVGDCSDFSKVPTGAACSFSAPTAGKNLMHLIETSSSSKPAKMADASGPPAFMILATGPKTGVSSLPIFGTLFGNFFSTLLKSKDLMLGAVRTDMKADVK